MSTTRLDRVRDADRGLKLVGGFGGVAVAAALLAFLAAPGLTLYPLLAFVAVVGYGWLVYQDSTAQFLMLLTTVSTVVILGLITVYLILRSLPAFVAFGPDMFTGTEFGPEGYSLVPMIWGTLLTTAIAMAIAGPLGVAGALFLAEIAPGWLRELLKPAVEVLAGIPSIVYGFLGLVVLSQYLFDEFDMPVYGSLLAVGLVVGVMALPTVISVAEDAITSVPDPMKDGALALGATDWQTIKSVTIPASFSGVSAAVILGVGRAVGETMAATVILANIAELPDPLYDVFGNTVTLTSLIASQYGNASGLQMATLFAAGVVLFVTVMCLSIGSRYVEVRMQRKLGGKQ